jgi:hypothetical protein
MITEVPTVNALLESIVKALEIPRSYYEKAIARHRSLMTPKETPNGAVLEVSGDIELLRTGDVLDESPLEGIAQHYTLPRIVLADVVLDPSLPIAA